MIAGVLALNPDRDPGSAVCSGLLAIAETMAAGGRAARTDIPKLDEVILLLSHVCVLSLRVLHQLHGSATIIVCSDKDSHRLPRGSLDIFGCRNSRACDTCDRRCAARRHRTASTASGGYGRWHRRTFRNVLQPKVGVARARGLPCASRCARDVLPLPAELT